MIKKQWRTVLIAAGFLHSSAFTFVCFIGNHETATKGKGWIFNDPMHVLLRRWTFRFQSLQLHMVLFYCIYSQLTDNRIFSLV